MPERKVNNEASQTSSLEQWVRLVVAYLFIPLILLICGGDPSWWQAWFYAALILGAGIGGRIWAERRHPGLTSERQDKENFQKAKPWDKVLAPLMAVSLVFPMVIVTGLDHRYHCSPEFPLLLSFIGFILITLGYAFAAWALAENRFFYSVVCVRKDKGHEVCNSGPYRIVRHPGYAGNILPLLGIPLALGSLWALVPAAAALIITVIRTTLEDQTLQVELLGYQEYSRHVRFKLIPGLY